MLKPILLALLALCATTTLTTGQTKLDIGDKAPALTDVTWLKGEPVPAFGDGNIYVLDFWATWCGPCKRTLPELNALAKSRRGDGVYVIGAAIWPRSSMTPTDEFVAEKGDDMDYLVAEDIDGKTAEAFMNAARQPSIPTTMIVDREGTVLWIANPLLSDLDEAVAQVVDGTFDLAAAKSAWAIERAAKENYDRLRAELRAAQKEKAWEDVARAAGELTALDESYDRYHLPHYRALVHLGQVEQARALGRQLTEEVYKDSASNLNKLAWMIVDPEEEFATGQRDFDLALNAALRASAITDDSSPAILDTLARVYFCKGDRAKAIEIQTKAIELAEDAHMRKTLQEVLDEYQQTPG